MQNVFHKSHNWPDLENVTYVIVHEYYPSVCIGNKEGPGENEIETVSWKFCADIFLKSCLGSFLSDFKFVIMQDIFCPLDANCKKRLAHKALKMSKTIFCGNIKSCTFKHVGIAFSLKNW